MSKIIENIQPIVKFTYNTRNDRNQKMKKHETCKMEASKP